MPPPVPIPAAPFARVVPGTPSLPSPLGGNADVDTDWGSQLVRGPLGLLTEAVAVTQHHDSITGTAKQHVANDYAKRIYAGLSQASTLVGSSLATLLNTCRSSNRSSSSTGGSWMSMGWIPERLAQLLGREVRGGGMAPAPVEIRLSDCRLLNASICWPTVTGTSRQAGGALLTVYNPLAWNRTELIR